MSELDKRALQALRIYCEAAAIAAAITGSLVLIGWPLHIDLLTSVVPGFVTMKANTALCLTLTGISLWLLLPQESAAVRKNAARILALLVVLVGITSFCEYLLHLQLGIDELLFLDRGGSFGTTSPGRMAPATAAALSLLGLALLSLDWRPWRGRGPSQGLSLCAGLIALMAIFGYIFNANAPSRIMFYTHVALHTAAGMILLSSGIFLARPERGVVLDIASDGYGSAMARRFLPAILFIPASLGLVCLQGYSRNLYSIQLGVALYCTSNVAVSAVLVWWWARQTNKQYCGRNEAETELRDANLQLEERIALRTKALEQQKTVLAEQAVLLDLAPDAIFTRGLDDRVTSWNRGAAISYGFTPEQVLGQIPHEFLQTIFPIPLTQINASLLSCGRWEGNLVHTRADQSAITVASRWTLLRDPEGKPRAILEINNDITERRKTEEALRQSDDNLRTMVQGVKDYSILMLDPQGRVTTWNDGAERIYGYRAEEIIGEHFSKFYMAERAAQGKPADGLNIAAEQGRFEEDDWRLRKDGRRFLASVLITALRDTTGRPRGFAKITRDITERVEAESAREQLSLDQLRFKDEFLSHVSHEFRSPLTAIKQFTTIILNGLAGELNPEQREYQGIILKNVLQLQSMIDDLLEVTRLETRKLRIEAERTLVPDIVAEVLDTLRGTARAKGVTISGNLFPGLPAAYADPTRLRQILIILIDNAIKFTPRGGFVTIRARPSEQRPAFLTLEVSDTGSGIDPEKLGHIFDRLYQAGETGIHASRKGLGLGLFICRGLVTRQGGEIQVRSRSGHGSTFSFTVPVASIDRAIGAVFVNGNWPADSTALVVVEIPRSNELFSGEWNEGRPSEVSDLIKNCLRPDQDVFLPEMSHSGAGERFVVATFAGERGASDLAGAILAQVAALPWLKDKGLTVFHTMLNLLPRHENESTDAEVTTMATDIRTWLNARISLEAKS